MVSRRKRKMGGGTASTRKKRGSKRRKCQQRVEGASRPKLHPKNPKSSKSSGEAPQPQLSAEDQSESHRQFHGSKPGSGSASSMVVITDGGSRTESQGTDRIKHGELNAREVAAMMTAACSKTASGVGSSANWGSKSEEVKPNCIDQFRAIRKEIDKRRDNVTPLRRAAPPGFENYLMNQQNYALAGSESPQSQSDSDLMEPKPEIHPDTPTRIKPQVEEFLMEQFQERQRIRKQHLVEREKVVLSMEQETVREHNRAAAREQSNQTIPISFCTILKEQEIYNTLPQHPVTFESTGLSECGNDSMLQSSLKELDDKWSKIKKNTILRHLQEASSLEAKQKVDLELRFFDLGISINPVISKWYVVRIPVVHVADKF